MRFIPTHTRLGSRRAAIALALLATGLFAAWVGLGIGGDTAVRYGDDLGTVLAALAATVLCLRAAKQHGQPMRRFWSLLAGAAFCWTLAESVWAVYELVLHVEVPLPSWADLGYLAAIPFAVAALLTHPAMRGKGGRRARSLLDGLVLATALLFLSWTVVLGPLWRSTDLSTAGGVVTLAYPFGDVLMIFFVVLAVRGMTGGNRLSLWCLLGGLLAMALADSTYAYLTEVKTYGTGSLIDTGWVAAYLAIAVGAYCSDARDVVTRRDDSSPITLPSLVVPFVPVLLALTVAGVEAKLGHRPGHVEWIMALALVLLVLARQVLLLVGLARSSRAAGETFSERLGRIALGDPAPSRGRR